MEAVLDQPVLVLNRLWQAINVICAKRANSSPVIDPTTNLPMAPEADRARMLAEAMRARKAS